MDTDKYFKACKLCPRKCGADRTSGKGYCGAGDRIIAANIIGTKIILLIAVLSLIVGEGYLADICLIYAAISFLSVVVLARSVIEKKEGSEE